MLVTLQSTETLLMREKMKGDAIIDKETNLIEFGQVSPRLVIRKLSNTWMEWVTLLNL